MFTVEVDDGKYAVTVHDDGRMDALRHGEPWGRDLVGDNLVHAMAWRIHELEVAATRAQEDRARGDSAHVYGKNCPVGMVQVEFVGCDPKLRQGDYGWKPVASAFLDIWVDGRRFNIQVGNFHDGVAQRRGLHIVGPIHMGVELTSCNAASILLPGQPTAADVRGAA